MKYFTYKDYIACIHKFRLHRVMQLAEEGVEYQTKEQNYSHDKFIKNILKDKEEVIELIRESVKGKEDIKKEDIIRYTNSYITKKYRAKEADIVYYYPKKELFFLIEHQSTIAEQMPFRMLNYCIDIMQEWSKNRKIKKDTLYPIIVPIVIYTGDAKWKVPRNLREKQIKEKEYEEYKINLKYNLVDIHRFSYQFLLKKKTMLSYAMLIEKAENKIELIRNLGWIIQNETNKKKLDEVGNIIIYLLNGILEKDIQEELLEKINGKVGERDMSTLYERIQKENKKMIQKGKKEGIEENKKEIVSNMIQLHIEDEIIIKTTKIELEELKEIKKQIRKAV